MALSSEIYGLKHRVSQRYYPLRMKVFVFRSGNCEVHPFSQAFSMAAAEQLFSISHGIS